MATHGKAGVRYLAARARWRRGPEAGAPWALILAGGDGVRLRPLTRQIAGDDRPKQFCALLGAETLWEQTRRRAALAVAPARTITVVTETHERFYHGVLGDEAAPRIVVQPENRGTAPGLLYGLARIAGRAPRAPVVVLPSDHWVSDDRTFMSHVVDALAVVVRHPGLVVLLGIPPDRPEAEYGWIEPAGTVAAEAVPGAGPPRAPGDGTRGPAAVRRVHRFWEKPAPEIAAALRARGCVWNSFVMVGRVDAFLALMDATVPTLRESFRPLERARGRLGEARVARDLYAGLPTVDFSRQVLQPGADALGVLPVSGVRWDDLGDPGRVLSARGELARAATG